MNEEKIIRGLRFCAGTDCHCEECPYEDTNKGICIDNLMYEAADALEDAEKQIPMWIPCGERMPDELDGEQEYRCLVSHQRFNDMRPCFTWIDTARFKDGKFWSDTPTTHTIPLLVTHWMPLPKGAEEENKDV